MNNSIPLSVWLGYCCFAFGSSIFRVQDPGFRIASVFLTVESGALLKPSAAKCEVP